MQRKISLTVLATFLFGLGPTAHAQDEPVPESTESATPAGNDVFALQEPEPQVDCGPLGVDVYLRGSFNDFAPLDEARFDLRGNVAADLTVALDPELFFFKIADDSANFDLVNCGASVWGAAVTLTEPFALTCGPNSQNVQLDLRGEEADDFIFSLDASDAANPTITVTPASLDLVAPAVTITEPQPAAMRPPRPMLATAATQTAVLPLRMNSTSWFGHPNMAQPNQYTRLLAAPARERISK